MCRAEPITAAEIARRLGISTSRALAALHREGVEMDPGRQAAAVRAAGSRRRGTVPSLPSDHAEQAVRYYRDEGWSTRMIGEQLGVSAAKVRAELRRRGIPVHRRPPIGPGSRASRTEVPVETLRKLYVESEWSAEDVAAQLDSGVHVVLRTGHAHGVPIRQGGGGSPAVTAAVAVIDGLYRDDQISEVLDRHAVPRRPAGGDIAVRFPDPVPLTPQLLEELYHGAGCSSNQIELLTGQPQIVVRASMRGSHRPRWQGSNTACRDCRRPADAAPGGPDVRCRRDDDRRDARNDRGPGFGMTARDRGIGRSPPHLPLRRCVTLPRRRSSAGSPRRAGKCLRAGRHGLR